jgi:hypothetical protein
MTAPTNKLDRFAELLSYDPETGEFRWKVDRRRGLKGSLAGTTNSDGYIQIMIDYKRYRAHRLAWLFTTGEWPSHDVDHIDGNAANNRIANLRIATRAENNQNLKKARSSNKLGLLGVVAHQGRFMASIKVNGKSRCLGYFDDPQSAHAAYLAAKREIHPFNTI